MIAQKICPYCGHKNMNRAVYCFECRTCLLDSLPPDGMVPRHYELYVTEHEIEFKPDALDVIEERRKTRDYVDHLDNGLVCLRCSAVNSYSAKKCFQCNALLNMPDEVYQLRMVGSAQSSVGQVRPLNEDEVGLWGRGNVLIALVADGMGGAAAGEEASRFVREAVQASFTGVAAGSEALQELSEPEIADRLQACATLANAAIIERIESDNSVKGMGTTLTVAFLRGNRATLAHVGDSRAYLVKKTGETTRVTDDHSFVEVLVASGHITRRQAAIHPMRSVLYRALGHATSESVDIYHTTLEADDRLILCSDGLTRHITAEEISRISMEFSDPADIGEELLHLANHRGGEDNISVAVVMVEEDTNEVPIEELYPTPCELKLRQDEGNGKLSEAELARKTRPMPRLDADEDEDN